MFRCSDCQEEFFSPEQARYVSVEVKNAAKEGRMLSTILDAEAKADAKAFYAEANKHRTGSESKAKLLTTPTVSVKIPYATKKGSK
jgi:hypothetical protein